MSLKLKKTKQFDMSSISKTMSHCEHVLQDEAELTCGIATFAYVCSIPGKTDEEKILNAEQYLKAIDCVQKDRRVNCEQMKRALNHFFGLERGLVTSLERVAQKAVMYLKVDDEMFHWVTKEGDLIRDSYDREPYHISQLRHSFSRAYNLD
ncbi:hypothetical protein [Photobacterium satsumensis]|uniref:hypothetical protein n=1 Tax=Photobacterium satsumensis TaxID=2910239 RepID=UPI003D09767E